MEVKEPTGKLGVLIPGLGAVATTLIAGVEAIRKGIAQPVGSITQMGNIHLNRKSGQEPLEVARPIGQSLNDRENRATFSKGRFSQDNYPKVKDFVPLASLEDLVFGGWDIYEDNVFEAASRAKVLEPGMLHALRSQLEAIKPMKGVFDKTYVKNLDGTHIKQGTSKYELAKALMDDISKFQYTHECDRLVMVWCGSTEKYIEPAAVHDSIEAFEKGLKASDPLIAPSMIYAYAAVKMGIPFLNGAPNLTCDIPALIELSKQTETPIGGKDFKTGQTLMKTILAPGLQARALGVKGWFSTNILGNRDGYVLDEPDNFRTKEVSKLSVLEDILRPDLSPELYGELYHKIRINYYPPHGDNKESWDNIDIFGWLGYSMQIKINFLCRDSILAAPLVLDLALFGDLAKRAGLSGTQEWLSFYFKSPQTAPGFRTEHDIFKQLNNLQNALRKLMGEELINPEGLYFEEEITA